MRRSDAARWFDASPNAYMIVDRELRYVAANAAYLAVTGTTREQLIGRPLFELFPHDPDDPQNEPRRLLESSLNEVLRTRERDSLAYIPYRVARAPGAEPELRIWSATHIPLLDERGEVEAILQHTEDVTALRRGPPSAAKMLSRAEAVQRHFVEVGERLGGLVQTLDQAPGFMALLRGPDHVFEFSNQAYNRLVGGRRVVGLTVREALPDVGDQGYFELLDRVYATKEPFVGKAMRVALRQPGGEYHDAYVDFMYQPIIGPDGNVFGILVQGHQVTELVRVRLRDQFRTRASEHIAAAGDDVETALVKVAWAAVETVADWAVVDLFEGGVSRRIVAAHADPARATEASVFLRYPLPVEIPSSHPLHGLEASPRLTASLSDEQLVGAARGPEHLEFLRRLRLTSMLTVPLLHRQRLYGILALMHAQSRRRYDESDLAPMVELGRVIATAFDNARLSIERQALLEAAEEARERAEAASRAKDDFLAMLGHELRNPLAPIVTAVDLLRLRASSSGERELQIIERQARHLVRLVDDMLDVSRIVHGKLELRRAPVRVTTVVNKAVEIASPALEAKQHRIDVSEIPGGALLFGDEDRIAQILANLLLNAARYTPSGGLVQLGIELDDDEVVFRVCDDGVGIAPEILPRIFDLFVQAPQTTERARGGLGLGLTLVKQLVTMHGGSVQATSSGPDRGSELTVRLPRHRGEETLGEHESVRAMQGVGRRVVVVDDNVDAAELLAAVLDQAGHRTDICHDGLEGLSRIVSDPPDLAIVDLGLPGIDGIELAARVRQRLGPTTPRLIALTGYGGSEDRARTADAGFEIHLTKPIDAGRLLEIIADGSGRLG